MWRTFWHTDPVTCLRVFTRAWVAVWRALPASPSLSACGKMAALGLPLLASGATPAPAAGDVIAPRLTTPRDITPLPADADMLPLRPGVREGIYFAPTAPGVFSARPAVRPWSPSSGPGDAVPQEIAAQPGGALPRVETREKPPTVVVEPPTWLLLAVGIGGAVFVSRCARRW